MYRAFFGKLETVHDYHKRAANYVIYFSSKRKAIKVLDEALANPSFNEIERSSIYLQKGILYYRLKNYNKSKENFEPILKYLKKEKFPYTKELSAVILTYYNLGEKEKARELYHILKGKEKYDKGFSELSYLDRYIWK